MKQLEPRIHHRPHPAEKRYCTGKPLGKRDKIRRINKSNKSLPQNGGKMLKSIEFNSHIRNRLAAYLKGRGLDFQTAMREEKGNKEIASIIHGGLPVLVRKLYSEQKMQKFFWEKRDLIADYISRRMQG
nr:hypothetical protein NMW_2314 [Neisseria meningitidis alpha275]